MRKQPVLSCRCIFYSVFAAALVFISSGLKAQHQQGFLYYDSITLFYYNQSHWENLAKTSNEAIRNGIDYYYLRMRAGIAFFSLAKYRLAIPHFEKALSFNASDPTAFGYLYHSYRYAGFDPQSFSLLRQHPSLAYKSGLKPPLVNELSFYSGYGFSSVGMVTDTIDYDGEANIYGELNKSGNLYYWQVFGKSFPFKHVGFNAAYTELLLNRTQLIRFADNDTSFRYKVHQKHVSLLVPVSLGKRWQFTPAVHLIGVSMQPFTASYDPENNQYDFSVNPIKLRDHIVSGELTRQFPYFLTSVSAGFGQLNRVRLWQVQAQVGIFPAANRNQYIILKVASANENILKRYHAGITAGTKLFPFMWIEAAHYFNDLNHVWDDNGVFIYNAADKILSRTKCLAYFLIGKHAIFRFDYTWMRHSDFYIKYIDYENVEQNKYFYNKHHVMGGITWNF